MKKSNLFINKNGFLMYGTDWKVCDIIEGVGESEEGIYFFNSPYNVIRKRLFL